jgi:hypothetical protein
MVEIIFGIITRQAIRRGTFRSVKDPTAAIGRSIDAYNQRCHPFTGTKHADDLIAKASRPGLRARGESHPQGAPREPKAVRGTRRPGRLPDLGQQAAPMVGRPLRGLPR